MKSSEAVCWDCPHYDAEDGPCPRGRGTTQYLYCLLIYERMTIERDRLGRASRATRRVQERGGCPAGKF